MGKIIKYDLEAKNALKIGIDALANAVKVTLGPKGRNVTIQDKNGNIHITKDGVSVAKEVELNDSLENLGVNLIKSVANKTANNTGDGTTTATILAQSIIDKGMKYTGSKYHLNDIKRGIDKAVESIVDNLKNQSVKISEDFDKIKQVASISANNEEIGVLIADCFKEIGTNGIITLEESKTSKTYSEVVEGVQIDRGYISPYFVTNKNKLTAELDNPYILVTNKKLSTLKSMFHIMEMVAKENASLLIVADDVDGELLSTLLINKTKGYLNVCCVKAPAFGDRRTEILRDLSVLTGGTFINESEGVKLEDIDLDYLGRTDKVIVSNETTTFVNSAGSPESIEEKVKELYERLNNATSEYEATTLKERISKLTNGIAVIKVGANSELELFEKKDRIEDALHATRAAIEEGIVPGGGVALVRCIKYLEKLKYHNESEKIGIDIIKESIEEPIKQILINAGIDYYKILEKVKKGKSDYGYNALTNKLTNLIKDGVIDPTKVTRVALENAASIAGMLLTTECVIVEENENKIED